MIKCRSILLVTAASILIAGCGGGGGEVNSTPPPVPQPPAPPAPPPPPPPPTNTSITDIRLSQNFVNDASTTTASFNLTSGTTISARANPEPVSVRFDAATNSYTISSAAFMESFGPADRQPDRSAGEILFRRGVDGQSNLLTLVTTPFTSSVSNQFVGLGFLQRNSRQADRQDTTFTIFAFGLDTPATAVPRMGSGRFAVDVFGFETFPGSEPNAFQGRGRFDVDFISGLFSTKTTLTVRGLVSGSEVFGGGLELEGGGRLSSSDGRFSGDVVYRNGSTRQLGGVLSGRFFGPNADEVGASFSGAGVNGSAFSGSFTGQRDASLSPANVSFNNLVTSQNFFGDAVTLTVRIPSSGAAPDIRDTGLFGSSRVRINDQTSGNLEFATPSSNLPSGQYTVTSIVPGDVNFTTYQASFGGLPTRLELYKPGSANRELALTYASFGRYSTTGQPDPFLSSEANRVFFAYGFRTPDGLFNNRTGSATYNGVAYGSAANPLGTIFDVTGTSQVAVDFSAMRLSGALTLRSVGLSTPINFGSFAFAGQIFPFQSSGTADISGTGESGRLVLNFFGPSAEEVAGPFRFRVPDGVNAGTLINGVVAAKRQ